MPIPHISKEIPGKLPNPDSFESMRLLTVSFEISQSVEENLFLSNYFLQGSQKKLMIPKMELDASMQIRFCGALYLVERY
jgi:hypothetical protein